MSRLETNGFSFKSIRKKIKVSLHSQKWKDSLIFLAFILLSFGFWYLQSLQQDYEIEIAIPIRYKNVPPEITFTDTIPDKVIVKVRDKGSVLLNYSFGRKFVPIESDMKNLNANQGVLTIDKKEIESDIYKQLLASTTLIGFEPGQIKLKYSKRAEKSLPIVFNGNINLEPGYQISDNMILSPSSVQVFAAQTTLDTITEIKTSFTDIKKANKTTTRILTLQKIDGVAYNPESVSITIPVEEFTDKTLEIPVQIENIPSDYTIRLFPPTIKVTSSIPLSRYKELSGDLFSIKIPFSDLEQNLTGIVPIELNYKPEWVKSTILSPEKCEFILEQQKVHD